MNVSKKDKPELMEVTIPFNAVAVIDVKAKTPQEAYKKAWDRLIEAMNLGFEDPGMSYRDFQEDEYVFAEVDGCKVDGEGNLIDDRGDD